MDLIWDGFAEAFRLIWNGDPEILGVTILTLIVSGAATLVSLLLGTSGGMLLALARFPGRRFLVSIVNASMGLPPVVVGLWVTIFLWRNGPLGFLRILYTPWAIIVAQVIIATPIIAGFSIAAIQNLPAKIHLQILALGASRWQYFRTILKETRLGLMAAVIAGFGSVISEIGASMMVGGNIKGYTRVLTTATAMEVSKGSFAYAVALSLILVLLSFSITFVLTMIQQWERRDRQKSLAASDLKKRTLGVGQDGGTEI